MSRSGRCGAARTSVSQGELNRYEVPTASGRRLVFTTVAKPPEFWRLVARLDPAPAGAGRVYVTFHPPGWHEGGPTGPWVDFYAQKRLENPLALAYVGFTMFETDRIAPEWVASCNGMDEIWVPSEFNRATFVQSGVDPRKVFVIPLGLDLARYRPASTRPLSLPGHAGFNFLSVFEWNKRKGYDILLRAYAEEFSHRDDVALVVRTYGYVGRGAPNEAQLRRTLLELCPHPERAPRLVVLEDRFPDDQMPSLYAACGAFVLPSRGEGWGIPYMEAMAMGLPTIGTRWSANTAFMTDENAFLIETDGLVEIEPGDPEYPHEYWGHHMAQPSLDHLKKLMRQVYEDRVEARRRGAGARRDVARLWTREHSLRRIVERLETLGRRRWQPTPGLRPAVLVWSAPLLDPSGYADEARNLLLGLDRLGVAVRAAPIVWSQRTTELPRDDAASLARLRQTPLSPAYVHVQHIFPPHFRPDPAAVATVGRTMFETDRLPADWVAKCNEMDEVWVPSEFNLETFARSGVDRRKLHKVPGAIDARRFRGDVRPLALEGRRGFAFLSVFDWSLRKGWDALVRAYVEEFVANEDVCLYLKVYSSYGQTDRQLLDRIRTYTREALGREPEEMPKIVLLGGVFSEERMLRLYRSVDAYVMPSRGEGWGRPFMEAMASGLPTIGTGWSGNTEFMTPENSYLVEYELVDVPPEAVAEAAHFAGHRWAEPSVAHLRALMRQVFADREAARASGARAGQEILERYDRPVVAQAIAGHVRRLLGRPVWTVPVAWEGSQLVYHSLAHVNRELCLQLLRSDEVDLSIIPYERHQFDTAAQPRFAPIEQHIRRPTSKPAVVHVRHQWPPCFEPPQDGAWVMIQPWEFGGLPAAWIEPMRDTVDEIWVPSSWVRECYVRSGVPADKVAVIPNGVDTDTYRSEGAKHPLKTTKRFKFLFVGGTIGRKGIDILLETYLATFTAADDVCLVVKAVGTDSVYRGSSLAGEIARLASQPGAPAFEYIDVNLSDDGVAALYRACDALVHPYRGEGFGLPVAEAMASGLPVIVTGYGACLDFCDEATAYLVPAHEVRVPQADGLPPAAVGYWWAEPDRRALAALMRRVVADPEHARETGRRARQRIVEQYQWAHAARRVRERLLALAGRTPRRFLPLEPFRAGVEPWPLDGRRRVAFFHHPRWDAPAWQEVVTCYARAFGPEADVTLILWLDPAQGVSEVEAGERVAVALARAGLDPERVPDLLLVPDGLDLAGLGRLYAAVDWVVPHGDPLQAERAARSGARVLGSLDAPAWRAARVQRAARAEQGAGDAKAA